MHRDWRYYLNFDTVMVVVVIIAVIYCLFTFKKKKYDFIGLDKSINLDDILTYTSKKKSKKGKGKSKYGKSEERCREIFERIFRSRFKSVRPQWLKNPVTGKNLELDGFCPQIQTPMGMGLAFEYDGKQHSVYSKHFHRGGKNEFIYQTKKDSWKDLRCKQEGVLLIRIPHTIIFEDLERHIRMKLRKAQVRI